MTGHPIARYCIHILTFVTLLVAGGRAFAQIESKVLMREDFEGDWDGRADAWDADSSIKFNLDTKVAHSGKASLRLTPEGMSDVCHGNSAKFSGAAGVNYRISFWVKADSRVKIIILNYPDNFRHVHGTSFVTSLKWRKITFGGRISFPEYVGAKSIKVQFQIHNYQKPVNVWIDDLLVEEGGQFAEEARWTPPAVGHNLIPNGSFEVDPSRHYMQWHATNDRGPDQNWQLIADAAFGSRSLKLRYGPNSQYGAWRIGPPLELTYPLAFDSADAEFTLSASVKMGGQPAEIVLVLGPSLPELNEPIPPGSVVLKMLPTEQWTRYSKTFRLPRTANGKYYLYIRGGDNVLLDGLMLARGKGSKFVPWQPVEATLTSDKPWRVYTLEDPLAFTLRAVRTEDSAPMTLVLTLVNYRQRSVRKMTWHVDAPPGKVVGRPVTLDPLPQGCYRAELRAAGKPAVLSDLSFSVMPEPRRVPYTESNYGFDTDGLEFNTHDWDISPMFLRLGFHWARVWSPMCLEDTSQSWTFRGLSAEQGAAAAQLFINNLKKHGFGIYVSTHQRYKYHTTHGFPFPPNTEEQYADYEVHLRELASRFGDRIDYWEIGNEPNPPVVTPENYARMVHESVRVLRDIDPDVEIISLAGAADGDKKWIERSIKAGAIAGVDGISFHYGGQTGSDTAARYRQWREWACLRNGRPLQVWDSEENIRGPSFYPIRVQSPTGVQDVGHAGDYPALFCRDSKVYLCNSAMNIRTITFSFEYTMTGWGYERGFWERAGALRPAAVATFLAAQRIQTANGGGLYRTPNGLFGALVRDSKESVLIVWSEKYTGTCQVRSYSDPFDIQDLTPRPIEELENIPDFYRDVDSVEVKVPRGMKVLDTMGVPIEIKDGKITVDIYPTYLVVPRAQEKKFLSLLKARQLLAPLPSRI